MNKKVKNNYEQLALRTGLRFDEGSGILYGYRNEYGLIIYALNESAPYNLTVAVSAKRAGGPLTKEECKQFAKEHKPVFALNENNEGVIMVLKGTGNQEKLKENLEYSLNVFLNFLRSNGYQNCCQTCGSQGATDVVIAGSAHIQLCPECYTKLQQTQTIQNSQKKAKTENIIGGLIGALIGSLLGVLCIVIIGQMGYVAALSGLVMAVCTLKGYELLGGKLSTLGIVIGVVLMAIMTYVGNQLDWAIFVARELDVDVITSFQAVPLLVREEMLDAVSYWGSLAKVYIFVVVGAVPTVRSIMKDQKNSDVIYRLSSGSLE